MTRQVVAIALLALAITAALGVYALQPPPPSAESPAAVPDDGAAAIDIGIQEAANQACGVLVAQANDDYWTTSKNTPITASPLANDPDNVLQNFGGHGQPGHGTAEQVGLDAVKYTPDTGFTGSDSFYYTHVGCLQCSGSWCSEPDFDVGTVHVTVTN
jgi:hypothetical protein